ncbi:MAG: alpha/beta fold hydrolase [Microbacteriaceae bacterium]
MSYAPFALVTDDAALGLTRTTVSNPLGSAVARHRAERTSTRATIFLHGAAGSWTTWTPLYEAAAAQGIELHNPVFIDMPGWGDAHLTENAADQTIDTVCNLVKDVAETLGFTEWDIIGHSMGGFIALHMAAIWPQNVLSIGLVSPTTWSVIESVEHPVRRFGTLPAFTMLRQAMRAMAALGRGTGGLVRFARRAGILRAAVFPLFRHPSRIDRTVIDALAREVRPRSFSAAAEITRGYTADQMWSRIVCPVLALKGDKDVFVTDGDFTRLETVLRDATLTVIPDCGHFAAIEKPAETLEALGLR